MEKKELLNELSECYDFFVKETQDLFNQYNAVLETDSRAVEKYNKPIPTPIFFVLWFLILIAFVNLLPIFVVLLKPNGFISLIIIVLTIFFMLSVAPKIIWNIVKRPKKFAEAQKNRVLELEAIFEQVKQKYNTYPAIMGKECILSVDYVEPTTIQYIYSLINSGRADTIKEALNIIETENKMNEMSNSFQSQINRINRDLANIETSVRNAEDAANLAAWSSWTSK